MSGTLALAAALAAMDRTELQELLRHRSPADPGAIRDPLGLALELLKPESIDRALTGLDRSALAALHALAADAHQPAPAHLALLRARALVGDGNGAAESLEEVTERLSHALAQAGIEPVELTARRALAPSPGVAPPADTTAWFTPALTQVRQASAVLGALRERPGRMSRRGTIAVAALRELAERACTEAAVTERLLRSLELSGLTIAVERAGDAPQLHASEAGDRWLTQGAVDRWIHLASGRVSRISPPLRACLADADGSLTLAAGPVLTHEFPLLPENARAVAEEFVAAAEDLGLTVSGSLADPARALLLDDESGARRLAERDMPDPVPGVYVQPDLSVIVPGPLDPADEEALFAVAETEQLGAAAALRVTVASLNRARAAGWTTTAVRALLDRLSLTGIPQPLDYLLAELDRGHGSITAHEHHGDEGRTRLEVTRPEILETLQHDRGLHHLQLTRGGDERTAFSRMGVSHVLTALGHARYPVSPAEPPGDDSPPRPSPRTAPSPPAESAPSAPDPIDALTDRVLATAGGRAGDLTRRIELAIRERSPIRVTAASGSQERSFLLVPVSLTAGRLRAADQTAGVERTFPISAIVDVTPAETATP